MNNDPEKALRFVREAPVIAFDVESSGVDWKRNATVGYVITVDKDNNTYTPIRHGGGGNIDGGVPLQSAVCDVMPQHPWEIELSKAFQERNRRGFVTIGHATKFDAHFAANHGVLLGRNLEDTALNEAILDEYAGSYSLDACCKRRGVSAKLGDELYQHMANKFGGVADRKQMANFWRLPGDDELAVSYALQDGVSTLELRAAQLPHIMEEYEPGFSLEKTWRLESDLIWTTWRLERRGIKISEEQLFHVKRQLAAMEDEARAALPKDFNVRSGAQVQRWLEQQGVIDFERTAPTSRFPDGQVSIRQKWLEGHPLGKPIVALRKIQDLTSKFIAPLEERHIFKGRVYGSFEQMRGDEYGTISGRYSSHSPNLQQLPSRDKVLGPILRSVFVPDDGMEFWESDYSQAEPRLFSHFTRSKMMIDGYNATPFVDMHSVMSGRLAIERDLAKRVNMALLTGQSLAGHNGQGGFANHMGWPLDRAKPMYDTYFEEFPELREFHKKAKNAYAARGYVKTMIGRQFRLDDSRYAYRAVSRVIQGNQADILKWNLRIADRMCEEAGDEAQILATVHDSIAGQNPKTEKHHQFVEEMLKRFGEVQVEPFNLLVPFVTETGFGSSWGEAKFGGH
jgi:DNA polymerase I-like protein with 3'-5' exonuclease and polymerase domains